ncbi:MAG: SpoIID/LytB domain-containing protein [Thermoanaerobaculia bacterium]
MSRSRVVTTAALVLLWASWISPGPRSVVAADAEGSSAGAAAPILTVPHFLRVGLATDLAEVSLPCCSGGLVAEVGGRRVVIASPVKVEPAAEVVKPGSYRVQAAALKDEQQSRRLAKELEEMLEEPADVVFDAGTDLYRVRVGRYQTRAAAEASREKLAFRGVGGAWVVTEKGVLGEAALKVSQGAKSAAVESRWLRVRSENGEGIRFQGARYRGRLLVYLNDRGRLNVINEVALEDYLRGVVPREMGPEVYDSLEALKAQSVAARTYTLRNLGEFSQEGYDICATPRCQVYAGMDVEHPLTDQAIAETAGQVLSYNGELVDALYSSTCGGHTENVEVVFPLKHEPYLRGVPCLEAGVDRLAGRLSRGVPFPGSLMQELLPPAGLDETPAVLAGRLEHLALLAGLPVPTDELASLERRELQRFIGSIFDLAVEVQLFVAREDLPYLLDHPPAGWDERDLRLAAYLVKSGLLAGDLSQPLTTQEIEETLFRLAIYLRVLEEVDGRYQGLTGGRLQVRTSGKTRSLALTNDLTTFRRAGNQFVASPLALVAGDRLTLYIRDQELLAVTHQIDPDGVAFDRTSNMSSWTRFRTDDELSSLVNARFPGLGFSNLVILSRGVSGRVGRISLDGADGREVEVEGLAVRWTLDLPDTLFTAKRLTPPNGAAGWLFTGRGWGHGVGLCQVGAYGMGLRGHSYRDILEHFYTGVEISAVETSSETRQAVSP